MTTLTSHLVPTKQPEPVTTPAQKKFDQLKMKVQSLQEKQSQTAQELDASLEFYYTKIRPEEEALLNVITERVLISYQIYKNPKSISKHEFKALKKSLIKDLDTVQKLNGGCNMRTDIKKIFSELNGVDYDKLTAHNLASLKSKMQEEFKHFGKIDFSNVHMNCSEEEMMNDIYIAIDRAAQAFKDSGKEAQKEAERHAKKQQEKDLQEQAAAQDHKKGINGIYKQLARTLHPDLEQNAQEKARKEELVKKLTHAYKTNDLFTILSIEKECAKGSTRPAATQNNDEQFKIYTNMLREQAHALQDNIDSILMDPKYEAIQRFYRNPVDGKSNLKTKYDRLKKEVALSQELVKDLKTKQAPEVAQSVSKK